MVIVLSAELQAHVVCHVLENLGVLELEDVRKEVHEITPGFAQLIE